MQNSREDTLKEIIHLATGSHGDLVRVTEAGGGSISRSFIAETQKGKWFVKTNRAELVDMFAAEADGLVALATCAEVRVPRVAGSGVAGGEAYLVLEYIEMRPLQAGAVGTSAGRALAAVHRPAGEKFGWPRDNYIGSTPQSNRRHGDWPDFFARERLSPQLGLAERRGNAARLIGKGRRLAEGINTFFAAYRPQPSLLHGDLWGGNAAIDGTGKLVLFDPAVHFGDREADLAMTELFGGFPPEFYAAYRAAWPLADGYPQRRTLYNLYHVLNHFNLFGGGYGQQAERMVDALLSELG